MEDIVETKAVPVIRKDILTSVTAEDYVVDRSRSVNTRLTWHDKTVSPFFKSSRPDPTVSNLQGLTRQSHSYNHIMPIYIYEQDDITHPAPVTTD
jgi:hypothetical protein